MTESPAGGESRIIMKGSPASPGVVIAEAYVIPSVLRNIPRRPIGAGNIPAEIRKFKRALKKTREEVLETQRSIGKKLGKEIGRIFDAHLLILEDGLLIEETSHRIRSEAVNAEYAIFQTISNYLEKLGQVDDDYLREREVDIRDVGRRIVMNISGGKEFSIPRFNKRVIIVVRELSPSMTAVLTRNKVSGIATDASGKTSHAVIFARSLEIPAVIGLGDATRNVSTGDTVILDGIAGLVIVNPDDEEIEKYNEKVRQYREFEEELSHLHSLPAVTLDGHSVHLSANIEIPLETKSVVAHGARGVGLFRTEFLLLNREDEPSEDEQCEIYSRVVKKLAPEPVVIRTFDIGGDKIVKFINNHREQNPYLGWRAIRICLERESLLRTQLRAILRATVKGNLKVMFPLITCLEELEGAVRILKEEENKLKEEGVELDEGYETGIMIETPAAAAISDILAKHVDFFSIGTNDLIMYTMAADRDNARVAHLYQPFHPGVIRFIKQTIDAAKEQGIWVGICGEMGANPLGAILLVGLGIDEISISPVMVPEIKTIIRAISLKEARRIAASVLTARTQDEVIGILKKNFDTQISELFIM